jgi:hypothetical protein
VAVDEASDDRHTALHLACYRGTDATLSLLIKVTFLISNEDHEYNHHIITTFLIPHRCASCSHLPSMDAADDPRVHGRQARGIRPAESSRRPELARLDSPAHRRVPRAEGGKWSDDTDRMLVTLRSILTSTLLCASRVDMFMTLMPIDFYPALCFPRGPDPAPPLAGGGGSSCPRLEREGTRRLGVQR